MAFISSLHTHNIFLKFLFLNNIRNFLLEILNLE